MDDFEQGLNFIFMDSTEIPELAVSSVESHIFTFLASLEFSNSVNTILVSYKPKLASSNKDYNVGPFLLPVSWIGKI